MDLKFLERDSKNREKFSEEMSELNNAKKKARIEKKLRAEGCSCKICSFFIGSFCFKKDKRVEEYRYCYLFKQKKGKS